MSLDRHKEALERARGLYPLKLQSIVSIIHLVLRITGKKKN